MFSPTEIRENELTSQLRTQRCDYCGNTYVECDCQDHCAQCGSNDWDIQTSPGMAGWASPITESTCQGCGYQVTTETVIYDEYGDIA